jgi:cell wall-associated NlpC family hydrolase
MRMPIGEAQEKLLQQIQTQRNTYTRFRSSQAFEELEQEVDGYRQREEERKAREQGRASAQMEQQQNQTTEDAPDAQVEEREAQGAETRTAGDAPTEEQVQAPEQETPDAQVEEREAQEAETRTAGDAPTEEQVQAPEQESSQQTGQQGGDASMSKAQRIEAQVRAAAEPWMGTPYKFGGESKNGVDCSGLTKALYEEAFNITLPRTTGKQVNRGRQVSRSNLRPGDLIFFRTGDQAKHVGIYLDDRKFVHASSSQGVTISPMKYDYWQEHYWQTRRLSI